MKEDAKNCNLVSTFEGNEFKIDEKLMTDFNKTTEGQPTKKLEEA